MRSEPQPGPDGKLSTLSQILASGMGTKSLVVAPVPAPLDEMLAAAVEAAAAAEVAVVVVGLTPEQETEGSDKTTLALPGRPGRDGVARWRPSRRARSSSSTRPPRC